MTEKTLFRSTQTWNILSVGSDLSHACAGKGTNGAQCDARCKNWHALRKICVGRGVLSTSGAVAGKDPACGCAVCLCDLLLQTAQPGVEFLLFCNAFFLQTSQPGVRSLDKSLALLDLNCCWTLLGSSSCGFQIILEALCFGGLCPSRQLHCPDVPPVFVQLPQPRLGSALKRRWFR